jgi:hypothetical protein
MKLSLLLVSLAVSVNAFTMSPHVTQQSTTTALHMGWFDNISAGGSGKDELDDQWEQQQAMLKLRRKPQAERQKYFASVEERREKASKDFKDKWAWQTAKYGKGEDPLTEWKKRREDGTISDLENQYGDPKTMGGIPFPMPSFGVGGEFGLGGKFDNGGRFDLRLPYADQGYVDEDADVMAKLGNFFSGGKKKVEEPPKQAKKAPVEPKKSKWPWEQ